MAKRKLFGGLYNGRVLEIQHPRMPIIVPVPRPLSLVAEDPDLTSPTYDTIHYEPAPNGFPAMVIEEKER